MRNELFSPGQGGYSREAESEAEVRDMSSFDRVYRGILRTLYEGRLVPGQRLIAPALAQEFQASRNTVREVLNRLAATGVITMVRNQSPVVRVLSRTEMEELLEVVNALLSLAAKSAARSIEEGDNRRKLNKSYSAILESETSADLAGFVHARERYYRMILQVSGNRELIRLFPTMHVHLMRLQLRSIPLVAESAQFSDYAALNETILAGDVGGAVQAAEQHVRHMIEAVRRLPERMFAPERMPAAPPPPEAVEYFS